METTSLPWKGIFALVFLALCGYGFILTQLIIAGITYDTTTCSHGTLLLPTHWLIIDGSVSLGFSVILWILYLGYHRDLSVAICFIVVCGLPIALFSFAWTIVGAIILWRDNTSCDPPSLDWIFYISVVSRVVLIGVGCLNSIYFLLLFLASRSLSSSTPSTVVPPSRRPRSRHRYHAIESTRI